MKILLLGTSESGKSTFIKQMTVIHGNGYDKEERERYSEQIYQNIFESMKVMINGMDELQIPYEDQSLSERADLLRSVPVGEVTVLKSPFVEAIKDLWQDPGIQECYHRRKEYDLPENAKYFLMHLAKYLPTDQDIFRVGVTTTDIREHMFHLEEH